MYSYCKRILDLLLVVIFSPIWLSVLFIVSILIFFKLGRPVFFKQERLGQKGRVFKIYKFRSMTDEKDINGNLLADDIRLTKFGKFLRASSLDELPSLINVFKGEMAIVGPRPFIAQYKELYNTRQMRRHEVKPGITGWAQVNGRNAISWEEKFEYDVWYVDHYNLWIDLRIIFKTAAKVVVSEGINSDTHATMDYFRGSVDDSNNSPS